MTSSKSQTNPLRPDFSLEQKIEGPVCGLDEVGRGPLAGPVVAACVVIPEELHALPFVAEIQDSKKLSEKKLTELDELIREHFIWGMAEASPIQIDEMNILQASLYAMEQALAKADTEVTHALVDGNHLPKNLPCPATAVIKGDSKSVSIAAASILAKVKRDTIMKELSQEHPYYGWERNVGYPTPEHLSAIDVHGITPHHRRRFAPVANYIEFGTVKRQVEMAV